MNEPLCLQYRHPPGMRVERTRVRSTEASNTKDLSTRQVFGAFKSNFGYLGAEKPHPKMRLSTLQL